MHFYHVITIGKIIFNSHTLEKVYQYEIYCFVKVIAYLVITPSSVVSNRHTGVYLNFSAFDFNYKPNKVQSKVF